MAGKIFYAKDLRGGHKSRAMRELMADPETAGILNKPRERKDLYEKLKEKGDSGVTAREMKEILGELRVDPKDSLDKREVRGLAGKLTRGKYIIPKRREIREAAEIKELEGRTATERLEETKYGKSGKINEESGESARKKDIIGLGAVGGSARPKSKSIAGRLRF